MFFQSDRRWIIQYSILTLALFLPLFWAFRYIRNLYPISAWNVMMAGGDLQRGRSYYMLRGETLNGETVDIRPIQLTDGLSGRTWTMVSATVDNQAFKLPSLHPVNAAELSRLGGIEHLPPGYRMPDLLAAWGRLYNERLPPNSVARLKAIRIDMYRWESGSYSDFDKFIETWRKDL
jgi:hypothetical protein